ncbi:MAG: hypothetical protein Q4E34_01015, partial [Synergistaceae bacterium]|nr:hypothetical protein [Synergistaceae bacterium]
KADTTDWTAKLADAQLAFNNATGANDAAKKMDIYAAALAKVSLTAGDAKAKTEAYNEATRLTGEFGSALAERIREVEDAFEANGSINEAQSALNAIGEKYKLTAAQAKMLTDSLSELTKKAAENEKELQKKADEDKLTRAENLYNAETAFGGQASVETARQYIAVLEEMRSKVEVGSTAWQTLGEKIRKVNEDAMDLNLKNITKELNSCQTEVQGLASKFAIGLSDAFGQAAVGAADLGESISSLLQSFGQLIVKTMALNALKATFKGITGGGWDFSGILGGIFHDGGIVGQTASPMRAVSASVFANAPRLHTGNLRADEYPAILQRGEGVLSRKQMANLGRGGDSNAVTVNVTVNNSGGGDMTNEQAQNLGNMINKAVEVKVAETMYKFGRGRMGVAF